MLSSLFNWAVGNVFKGVRLSNKGVSLAIRKKLACVMPTACRHHKGTAKSTNNAYLPKFLPFVGDLVCFSGGNSALIMLSFIARWNINGRLKIH